MEKTSGQLFRAHRAAVDPFSEQSRDKTYKWLGWARRIIAALGGLSQSLTADRDMLCAAQIVTVASDSTGTLRTTINGVNIDVTSTEEEVADAALIVAALNASTTALVQYVVEADNRAGIIALTSTAVGTSWKICGVVITAVAKAADNPSQFEVSGNDTADGDKLVAALNSHPALKDIIFASNSAGTVTIRSRRASTASRDLKISDTGEVVTDFAAVAVVLVSAIRKGLPGNWVTLAVTGTGMTAGGARLAGGLTTRETLP